MRKRIEIDFYLIVGIYIAYFIGIRIIEPIYIVKIVSFFGWLLVEYYLISRLLFWWRKDKIQENFKTENKHKFHSIKYVFSEKIDLEIIKWFGTPELLAVEITENRLKVYQLKINTILFGEMLIEDINYIMNLFYSLRKNDEMFVISEKNGKKQTCEKSINRLMERYEDILCKRELCKNYFIYVNNKDEVTKIIHIDKNDIIRIYFRADEKEKIEKSIIK